MSKQPISTWCFALVIVRLGRRILLVKEAKHGNTWYFPAGRVESGETFEMAAARETLEEAGIAIALEGIHVVEWTPSHDGSARMRVVFIARPEDDTQPKSVADNESLEARWFTLEELATLPLRGYEVLHLAKAVLSGATIHPLTLLSSETS